MSGSIFISCNANELPGFHCIRTRECECSLLLCRQLTSSDRRTDGRTDDGRTITAAAAHFVPSVRRPSAARPSNRRQCQAAEEEEKEEEGRVDRCIGRRNEKNHRNARDYSGGNHDVSFWVALHLTLSLPNPTHQTPKRASLGICRIKAEKPKNVTPSQYNRGEDRAQYLQLTRTESAVKTA